MNDIKENWVHKDDVIRDIAEICQPASTVRVAVGESLEKPGEVHLLIEAEEAVKGDEDIEMATEKGDIVSEVPLQTMYRRKFWVSILYIYIALNLPRLQGSYKRKTPDSLPGCPVQRILLIAVQIKLCHIQRVFRERRLWKTKSYHHCAPYPNLRSRFPAIFGWD